MCVPQVTFNFRNQDARRGGSMQRNLKVPSIAKRSSLASAQVNTHTHTSLYHGVLITFWQHNALSYNYEQMALIISLLMNRKLVKTPRNVSINAEVTSWWKKIAKSDSSLLLSMMFKNNVGENGLSAQSSYTFDINDSHYIANMAPHPTIFDNKVPFGEDIFNKVYTQLITALNDVRVQKSIHSTLSAIRNRQSLNTFISQVKASDVVIESDDIEFYD